MRTERGVFFSSVLWICVALTVAPYCSIRGEEKRGKKISFIDAHYGSVSQHGVDNAPKIPGIY